jgi:hypothetical protein
VKTENPSACVTVNFKLRKSAIALYCHSSVGTATSYGLHGRSSIPGRYKYIFLYSTASRPALGPSQPPIQPVSWALSPGVKGRGRETNHSAPSSAELYLHANIHIHGVVLTYKDNFTVTLILQDTVHPKT